MSRNSKPSTAYFFFSWDRFTREKSVVQQTRWRFQICFLVHIWARIQLDETTSHVFIPFSKRKQFAFNAMLQPKLQIFVPEHKVRRGVKTRRANTTLKISSKQKCNESVPLKPSISVGSSSAVGLKVVETPVFFLPILLGFVFLNL